MFFLLRVLPILAALVILGVILNSSAPQSASLAGDVGLVDADVCAMLEQSESVARLSASGFPHATTSSVESYRLVKREGDAYTVEAQVTIDWQANVAACLPITYTGPVDATLVLEPSAYNALVGELQHVLRTGDVSAASPGNWLALTFHSSVDVWNNPHYGGPYKARVAMWAAGAIARGAWRGDAS